MFCRICGQHTKYLKKGIIVGIFKTAALVLVLGMLFAGCSFKAGFGFGVGANSSGKGGYQTVLSTCGSER